MGQHIAGPELGQHVFIGGRRLVDMRHERDARFLGRLQGHIERCDALVARGMAADPDLDADDMLRIFGRDSDRARADP